MKLIGKVKSRLLFDIYKKHIGWVTLVCVLDFISALLSILLALLSARVIDVALGKMEGKLFFECLYLLGTVLAIIIVDAASSRVGLVASCKADIYITDMVFSRFIKKRYSSTSSYHSGEVLNRLTSDKDHIISCVIDLAPTIVSLATRFIASFVIIVLFSWQFSLAIIGISLVGAVIIKLIGWKLKALHKECQASSGLVRSFLQESTENLVVVKTFSNYAPLLKRLSFLLSKDYRNKLKKNAVSVATTTGGKIVFIGGYYGALIWGAVQVGIGVLSYGSLTAFLQIISNIRAPFLSAAGLVGKYFSAVASSERIEELLNLDDDEELIEKIDISDAKSIGIENASFSYDKKDALKNCNAEIELGKMTCLIGDSGAGKSTLFRLLLGLYKAQEGEIYLKYGDGRRLDISAATRSLFTYVPQGNFLLTGTIRDNISFFDESISEDMIKEVARAAEILDVIEELPDGLDTMIGERGHGLSEGQVQRIAIARALLFDAPILLLDECTSAVDGDTEKKILENIKNLKNKTVVIITHRPQALNICDNVLKIKNETIEIL